MKNTEGGAGCRKGVVCKITILNLCSFKMNKYGPAARKDAVYHQKSVLALI